MLFRIWLIQWPSSLMCALKLKPCFKKSKLCWRFVAISFLCFNEPSINSNYHFLFILTIFYNCSQQEEAYEKEYQTIMGKRPPSIAATDLTREATKYQEAHSKANESNQALHKVMSTHINNLLILSLPLSQLQQQIPPPPTLSGRL